MAISVTRLGRRVTEIHTGAHRLHVSTGESFVYDKLISTLRFPQLQQLITDETPACIRNSSNARCASTIWKNTSSCRDSGPTCSGA